MPVTVSGLKSEEIVRGGYAENVHRKDFMLSEAVAIRAVLEPLERAAAKERQRVCPASRYLELFARQQRAG